METISKGHCKAPVAHTSSQSVHQPQLATSITVTVFPVIARAPHLQTVTHRPHPSHLSASKIGMIDNLIASKSINYHEF